MKSTAPFAAALIGATLICGIASAETIAVNQGVTVRESSVDRPGRGMTMETVETKFGQPSSRHAAVGQPPITRWDYPGFSVFFEHQYVIHAVVTAS